MRVKIIVYKFRLVVVAGAIYILAVFSFPAFSQLVESEDDLDANSTTAIEEDSGEIKADEDSLSQSLTTDNIDIELDD